MPKTSVKKSLKLKSATKRSIAITTTSTITINVETAISFLLDQLTFFISPSAEIRKSATEGLFDNQKNKSAKPAHTPTGIIVDTHNPKSAPSNFLYSNRNPNTTTVPKPKALPSLVYLPWPGL